MSQKSTASYLSKFKQKTTDTMSRQTGKPVDETNNTAASQPQTSSALDVENASTINVSNQEAVAQETKGNGKEMQKIFPLSANDVDFLNDIVANTGSFTQYLSNMATEVFNETGKKPFKEETPTPTVVNQPQEESLAEKLSEASKAANADEDNPFVPKGPQVIDENSAEYQAGLLGPLQSRHETNRKEVVQVSPEKALEMYSAAKRQVDSVFDNGEKSELDELILSQLPSETPHEEVVSVRPRDICPVDLEMDETGNISPFFNWEKTCQHLGHPEWTDKIKLTSEKTEGQFWKNVAKMQYNSWLKYSELSDTQKDTKDKQSKLIKIAIPSAAGLFLVALLLMSYLPKLSLSNGTKALEAGNYEEAVEILCNKTNNRYYCKYAQAMYEANIGEFEKAHEDIDILIDGNYQSNIKYDLEESKNEIYYKEGLAYLAEEKYAQGLLILRKIPNYKDVKDIYYSTCYRIATENEQSNKELSLRYYYMANDYKDAKDKFAEKAEEVYLDGLAQYYSGNYDAARETFTLISNYDYKDSADMVNQTIYRAGLDAWLEEDYETANSYFTQIPFFKDASSLIASKEQLEKPLSEEEIADLISKTSQEHPTWIMKVVIDSEGQSFTLYNGETFKFSNTDADFESNVNLFIQGHGADEAMEICRRTRNYQNFTPTENVEDPNIVEIIDENTEESETQENTDASAETTETESSENN